VAKLGPEPDGWQPAMHKTQAAIDTSAKPLFFNFHIE
jgi:hypothetical protein